jgi:hypothetical protein
VTDEQLRKTWEIFRHAADLPAFEQTNYVHSASSDRVVVDEVLALLKPHSGSDPQSRNATPDAGEQAGRDIPPVGTGSTVGPYTVTGLLGRGGLGEVFSARDTVLGRKAALKVLALGSRSSLSDSARQIREATAASSLNHPNIVSIYQVVETGSRAVIAMELVDGKPFRKLVGHPLPLDSLCHFGIQICRALAAAHRQGIIHRDIKPENLMVRPDGIVKILDFGLAQDTTAATLTSGSGIAVGTLRYMSPEQTRGAKLAGSTDIFSLGLVLYELACARHPFEGDSALEVAHAIATSKPTRPTVWNSLIPASLEALILAMLAKDPQARPSAEDVAEKLAAIGRGENATAGKTEAVLVPAVSAKRPRWGWGVAIACLAIAGGTALWLRPFETELSRRSLAHRAWCPLPDRTIRFPRETFTVWMEPATFSLTVRILSMKEATPAGLRNRLRFRLSKA